MARQRRGGGIRPPELRGTLGTLLRTTLAQAGTLRDALERGAREGRTRLDSALSNRRRNDALAELGEIVLDLIRQGEIDLQELPEVRDIVAHLDDLDADHENDHDEQIASPPSRKRFDSRGRDVDDGTVSSKTWEPPNRRKPTAAKVWRPPGDDDAERREKRERPTLRQRPLPRPEDEPARAAKPPPRKGGISFDDDDDLAEYMHPDDVPPTDKEEK